MQQMRTRLVMFETTHTSGGGGRVWFYPEISNDVDVEAGCGNIKGTEVWRREGGKGEPASSSTFGLAVKWRAGRD